MTYNIVVRSLLFVALVAFTGGSVWAQQDRELDNKKQDLKREFNQAREKQDIIRDAAQDKPRPSTGRRRGNQTTGYDYTQVKGYQLRGMYDRIDQMFFQAAELGLFDESYHKDGTFNVPGRSGLANAQLNRIEVYYVEATPEEVEMYGVEPFDIIEVRVIKNEQLPPEDLGGAEGEESGLGLFGNTGGESYTRAYTLSGVDLWAVIDVTDKSLYDDILVRRTQEPSIALPDDLFEAERRGPFVIMTAKGLETAKSRFNDFWNPRDTMTTAQLPKLSEAAGPFSTTEVPLLFPEIEKVRVRNPNTEPLKITGAYFTGDNADQFNVVSKTPLLLKERGSMDDKTDIKFEYIGESPYEVKSELFVEAADARLSQGIEVIANPGRFPADFVVMDFSLDQFELRSPSRSGFAPDWKLAYYVGNPEVNLPRWASSTATLGIGYKHELFVGVVMPFNVSTTDMPDPLAYKRNLLSSPSGYNIRFDFTFGFPFSLGGNLTVLPNKFEGEDAYEGLEIIKNYQPEDPLDEGTDKDFDNEFFHINTIAQVYYPIMFTDRQKNPSVAFRLDLGGGYMRVDRAYLVEEGVPEKLGVNFTPDDIGTMYTLGKYKDYADVYFRISFINLAAKNNYGIGLQYFNGSAMADAWLELTDWLRVEMKYAFLIRDKELWERDASYFMVTPRFRFGLPSIFN